MQASDWFLNAWYFLSRVSHISEMSSLSPAIREAQSSDKTSVLGVFLEKTVASEKQSAVY
jgi:hypothetical protein